MVLWHVADVACRSTLTELWYFSMVNATMTCHHKKTRHDTTLGHRLLAFAEQPPFQNLSKLLTQPRVITSCGTVACLFMMERPDGISVSVLRHATQRYATIPH